MQERTKILIGEEGVSALQKSFVTVVGVGGVGGYVAELLVRAGVGKIKLIDFDNVSCSNLNRQVVAFEDTIGMPKVEVLKEILLKINSKIDISIENARFSSENAYIVPNCDMCIDAIDSVKDKFALIAHCKQNNIPIISAMGAGNRIDIPKFILTDIYKTHDDGLAKAIRKLCRASGIDKLDVVTCESKPMQHQEQEIGSISYYPAMCGATIAAVVIKKKKKK